MNIVDSSGWLEFFADGPSAEQFVAPLTDTASLIVPVLCVYEVFKVLLRESDENKALQAVAAMQRGTVVEVSANLAMAASRLSLKHRLPMADSIILATARAFDAAIWTQDTHFEGLSGVRFFPKE